MIGNKWLNEAVSIEDIKTGVMNLIVSPPGSGKSWFALKDLVALAGSRNRMLYLIDTINGREQLLKGENTKPCSDDWINWVCRQIIDFENEYVFEDGKIVIMTYAKFGVLANMFPHFGFDFDVIVCDEIHSGIEMMNYSRKEKNNYPLIAISRLKQIIDGGIVKVVGLTATPSKAMREFGNDVFLVPVDEDVRRYEIIKETPYTNLTRIIQTIDKSKTGILYTGHITQMRALVDLAHQQDINAIAIWSVNNKDNPMTEEQHRVRQYILDNAQMPPEYNLLVINKSCETSITIKGDIEYMIIHSRDADRQTQVWGRLRGDLPMMYLLDYNAELCVPAEYMGIKLFKEDKRDLCDILKVRNTQGNLVGWTSTEKRLVDDGYTIINGRKDNRHYSIITL
ncbi:DEAD/DEAH box helicase family protein [Christensenellaceae bacterium OttesenSCG-928-K19]|nr:DEAD/DEAH box helicase family protein [Christensenellaceae bacterium OttesenSCG-928-K19]